MAKGLSRGHQKISVYITSLALCFGALKLPLLLQHTVAQPTLFWLDDESTKISHNDIFLNNYSFFCHSSKSYNIAGNQVSIADLFKCPVI